MKQIIAIFLSCILSSCGLFGGGNADPLDKQTIHKMSDKERIIFLLNRLKETRKKLQFTREKMLERGKSMGMYKKLFDEIAKCDEAYKDLEKYRNEYEHLRDKVYTELLRLEQIKGRMEMHKELYGDK